MHLKMDDWKKTPLLLGPGPFSGACAISFREGSLFLNPLETKKYRNVKAKTLGQGNLGQKTDWNTSSEELRPSNILFSFQILFQKGIKREWMPCKVFALQHLTVSERGGWVWWMPWDTSSACLRLEPANCFKVICIMRSHPIHSWLPGVHWFIDHLSMFHWQTLNQKFSEGIQMHWLPCQGKLRFLDEEFRCAPNCQGRGETWWEVKTGLNET